uniref:DLG associated protein 2 n=1 Tax=Hucho hucho TaxID=62062 RepID=A0A4W5K6U8_9TELE
MKALSGGRPSQLQITSAHTCGLANCEHSLDHHDSRTLSYLLSPTESCPMEHRRCSPHSSIHSECMAMPVSMANTDHSISSSTFPRMHYSSHHDDECGSSHGGSGKMNRIPANLLDQFEKQLPLHRDGFHTLQYQKTHTTTTEQRNESPGRIRHLVHSVQKLFTKSHSLEGSSKMNGTKGDLHREGSHHHHPNHHGHHKHSKRSKSKERKSSDSSGKQRSGVAGWWSSDDNLDSDSTYRTPSIMSRQQVDHISHCYPDSVHSQYGDLSLKTSKSNNDVKCSACESVVMAPEGKFMKRSSWSTLTVSQAKEAYRKSSLNLEKPMTPTDLKPNLRPCHYLQVPQDEWSGYPGGGKDDEIPCRRMRSSSYVKAMGDEESGESDSSPKTSPVKTVRPDALVKSVMQRPLLDSQRDMHPHHPSMALEPSTNYNSQQPPLPAAQFRSRNQSYMRAVSTLSQVSETDINGQFESVCESVFSEVESQAVEALDLPGCFRTRSHSYLRAIQAGYSQDDDCIPTMTSSTTDTTHTVYSSVWTID